MKECSAIRVRVPASSANLGPGFDALALALGLYLRCTLRESKQGFQIRVSGTDSSEIPCDESNLVWRAFTRLVGWPVPRDVALEIANEIPLGRGLGSSAAAIVAGLALANEWRGRDHSREQLIRMATDMEGHPDNVAAAVRGGLVVSCQSDSGVISLNVPLRAKFDIVLVVPQFHLATEEARAALPSQYLRRDAVFNVQRVALLVAALGEGRADLLSEALCDRLHQPYRAPLVPGFADILRLQDVPGLLGVALSGAGPSVIAFCSGHEQEIGEILVSCFRRWEVQSQVYRLPVDTDGLVVEREP